jgi:hypothetical protein
MVAIAAFTLSPEREATVTVAPAAAAPRAVASPIPDDPPKTSTRVPFNERGIRSP